MANHKKRILLITARSDMGGGPKQVSEILEHLGSEVDFYIAAPSIGEFAQHFQSAAKDFCELPHRKATITSLIKVLLFSRRSEIDFIHTHGFGAGIYSLLPALFGAKVIHTFHGLHFQSELKARVKTWIEVLLSLLRVEHVCVSPSEQRKARALGINSRVIPNGVPREALLYSKRTLTWPPKKAGVISRLDPFKNTSWIIDYFFTLNKTWPEIQVEIAGGGEQREDLAKQIKQAGLESQIQLVGWQKPSEFFDHIDLLICPSKGEGLPYTVLEAMAYGVPLIASDVAGHNDLLGPENLFSLTGPSFCKLKPQEMLSKNQERISRYFILENNLNQLQKLYREL